MKPYEATEAAYKNGYTKGIEDGKKAVANQVASSSKQLASKWIPVTDRLPEKSDYYLVITDNKIIMVIPYSVNHKVFNAFDRFRGADYQMAVTHWMPLPQPPEGE